jgi:hypothetical protein
LLFMISLLTRTKCRTTGKWLLSFLSPLVVNSEGSRFICKPLLMAFCEEVSHIENTDSQLTIIPFHRTYLDGHRSSTDWLIGLESYFRSSHLIQL